MTEPLGPGLWTEKLPGEAWPPGLRSDFQQPPKGHLPPYPPGLHIVHERNRGAEWAGNPLGRPGGQGL